FYSVGDFKNEIAGKLPLVDADLDGATLDGTDLTGARMAGAVVHDAAGKMALVTYEYLEAAGALGLDSIQGLPARSTNGNATDAH
ncbi:MAG: pentapeptide repeat-containing protein, partial [Specibacter sp.]